jgi:hypothetical protein
MMMMIAATKKSMPISHMVSKCMDERTLSMFGVVLDKSLESDLAPSVS